VRLKKEALVFLKEKKNAECFFEKKAPFL